MFGERRGEAPPSERPLEGEEREKFSRELADYVAGLEAALHDPDLSEEDRTDLEAQLEALKDSRQAISEGGEIRVKE